MEKQIRAKPGEWIYKADPVTEVSSSTFPATALEGSRTTWAPLGLRGIEYPMRASIDCIHVILEKSSPAQGPSRPYKGLPSDL